jgi:hypothetical protein
MGEGKRGRAHDFARITLTCIRLFNGVAALFVPATLARRLGVDPEANPAALYALRLFGVRTVLIGAQLLLRNSGVHAHSLRVAPVIHALDVAATLIAGERGQLPRRGYDGRAHLDRQYRPGRHRPEPRRRRSWSGA